MDETVGNRTIYENKEINETYKNKEGDERKEQMRDGKVSSVRDQNHNYEAGEMKEKQMIDEEVILLMDSNRKYIDTEKFWRGNGCTKIKAGNTDELVKIMDEYNFEKAKHIIIGVGTNDLDKHNAEYVCETIINISK